MRPRILVVEDDAAIREMVGFALANAEMDAVPAGDAREAWLALAQVPPDLVLLDWMLPGVSGLEIARRLRRDALTRDLPIIILTARGDEMDRVSGLDAGVDDYVVKPFSPRELVARIRAVLRRARGIAADGSIRVGGLHMDVHKHRLYAGEHEISLGPAEFRLLRFFMTHPERVYSRAQLLDQVWGGSAVIEERTVDVQIRRLRKSLEPHGMASLIDTVRGAGYRLSEAPQ